MADIVSETVLKSFDNDITAENSVETGMLYDLLMEVALKHAQETFRAVMGELRFVYDTMLAGINRTLAVDRDMAVRTWYKPCGICKP